MQASLRHAKAPSTALLLSLPAMAAIVAGCDIHVGDGATTTQPRGIGDFQVIDAETLADVEVTAGAVFDVTVICDDNLAELITTVVDDGVLTISDADSRFIPRGPCVVRVALPELARLRIDGAGSATLTGDVSVPATVLERDGAGPLTVDDLIAQDLEVTKWGAGSLDFVSLTADTFTLNNESGGSVGLAGTADHVAYDSESGGKLDSESLRANTATIVQRGGGLIAVYARESVSIRFESDGFVHVYGDPEEVVVEGAEHQDLQVLFKD